MEKYVYFDGLKFTRDDKTSYYLNSTIRKRLHRYVWEFYNGEIPSGYDIHHADHDKNNNDISNLIMIKSSDHHKLHGAELTEEQRENLAINLNKAARPAAIKWHKSAEGSEWHKAHYKQTEAVLHARVMQTCENCGADFEGSYQSRFCCNACKSAYRRKLGLDNIEKQCPVCGNMFATSKYAQAETCSRSCANRLRGKRHESEESRTA